MIMRSLPRLYPTDGNYKYSYFDDQQPFIDSDSEKLYLIQDPIIKLKCISKRRIE